MSNIFTIPDKEKNYQNYMVYVLTIVWLVITEIIVSIQLYNFPELSFRWISLLFISLFIGISSLTLNHWGHPRVASWSFIIMLWLYITVPCYSSGGILAAGILSQMSVILTAGLLLGWRGGFAIGILTIVTDFIMAYLEIIGHLPASLVPHNPLTRWVVTIIPFGTILVLQYYATNHLRTSLFSLKREIIKREETLEQLRASEERYKSIISISNTGVWEYHLDTEQIWYSSQYFAMIGIDKPENGQWNSTVESAWIDKLHPDDRERSIKVFDDFLKGDSKGLYENYFRLQHQNGEWVWIWSRAQRLLDANGQLTNICLGTHINISEQKKAEEKTRQSEQLIKKITSQVPSNTYMFEIEETGKTNVLFFSKGTDEINYSLNFPEPEKIAPKLMELLYEDDKTLWIETMKQAYRSQTSISFQYRLWLDGQLRWRWFRAIPEKTDDGKILWYGAAQDITPIVDYITSIEQTIFDIGHVIRRPISSMMGLTKIIMDNDLSKEETKEISEKLLLISEEMDKFIHELNHAYNEKRKETNLNIDVSAAIDKRGALFE